MGKANKKYELFTLREDTVGQSGHWNSTNTSPYSGVNASIQESNTSTKAEPTSIPSPFARMELARTAFAIAAKTMNEGKKWNDIPARYKKIVSDCLDVAEIFFNYELFKQYVRIIKWDPKNDLNDMSKTEFGKTIAKFMESDKVSYHFDRVGCIYFLDYIGDNRPNKTGLNIIGATSPITMFFSIDNDLSYVSQKINFNQDKPFDDEFNPLENRDTEFIKYMNLIRKQYDSNSDVINSKGKFAIDFKELNDYIDVACNFVNDASGINGSYNFKNIDAGNNDFVKVLEFPLGCQSVQSPTQSDFEIASSTELAQKYLPLVLPTQSSNGYDKCRYINDSYLWGTNNKAPFSDKETWTKRTLPSSSVKHPYLTVNDFFTDSIIKMPYELNSDNYFNGNLTNNSDVKNSYLLPLKPLIFEFFTVDEIMKMTGMTANGSVVVATLNIPIRNYTGKATNSFIRYEKKYQINSNIELNIGCTKEAKFGFGIFPLERTRDVNVSDYRIALFDSVGNTSLEFFYSVSKDSIGNRVSRKHREYSKNSCGVETYVVEKKFFDRVAVSTCGEIGYIIPKFKNREGNRIFKFAVDFGTTNTHIAYRIENIQDTREFNMNSPQMVKLHKSYEKDRDIQSAFIDCFVPDSIGGPNDRYKFPMRSAFAEDKNIDYNKIQYTLADGNIPFRYEEIGTIPYLDIKTEEELKWTAQPERLSLYIRNIAYMLRNKVIMESGQLNKTEIIWFYPASMSAGQRNNLSDTWGKAYNDFFDPNYSNQPDSRVSSMSESVAPYCYFREKEGAVGTVTTIDIGGGTTDVYISEGDDLNGYVASFRFASNAVFGDGYNNSIGNNGFVQKYYPIFREQLSKLCNNNNDLTSALNTIYEKGKSTDVISFFFSLASTENPGLNLINKLKEDLRYKYVFVFFYTAILYHIATSMKAKGIGMPNTVAFSGNGSKTLQILSNNNAVLCDFVKRIFESIYGKKYPNNVKFLLKYNNSNPKEATSLGGLTANMKQISAKPKGLVLLGSDESTFVSEETFDSISDKTKDEIIKSVEKFIHFVSDMNKDNFFGENFNIDVAIIKKVENVCNQNLKEYLDLGIDKIKKLLDSDPTRTNNINESLFFYPIVGMLNNLVQELYNMDN